MIRELTPQEFPFIAEWTGTKLKGMQVKFFGTEQWDSEVLWIPDTEDTCGLRKNMPYNGYPYHDENWRHIEPSFEPTKFKVKDYT